MIQCPNLCRRTQLSMLLLHYIHHACEVSVPNLAVLRKVLSGHWDNLLKWHEFSHAFKAWSWIPMFSLLPDLPGNPCHRNWLVDRRQSRSAEGRTSKVSPSAPQDSRDFPPSQLHLDQESTLRCNWPWGLLFSVAYSSGSFHHHLMIDHQCRLRFVVWSTHIGTLQAWNRLQVEAKSG